MRFKRIRTSAIDTVIFFCWVKFSRTRWTTGSNIAPLFFVGFLDTSMYDSSSKTSKHFRFNWNGMILYMTGVFEVIDVVTPDTTNCILGSGTVMLSKVVVPFPPENKPTK